MLHLKLNLNNTINFILKSVSKQVYDIIHYIKMWIAVYQIKRMTNKITSVVSYFTFHFIYVNIVIL